MIFAAVMVIAAYVRIPIAVFVALAAGDVAWLAVMATFDTGAQSSAPPWVRSRAVVLHTFSAPGSFAVGSTFWGAVSGITVLGMPARAPLRCERCSC